MSAVDSLKRRRKGSGRMGGGGAVQTEKTPPKNIKVIQNAVKQKGVLGGDHKLPKGY